VDALPAALAAFAAQDNQDFAATAADAWLTIWVSHSVPPFGGIFYDIFDKTRVYQGDVLYHIHANIHNL